jgi:hypothetical protein
MAVQADSVALPKLQPRSSHDVRAHRPGIRPRATAAASQPPAWQAMAGPPPGAGRDRVEAAHRTAVAGCARAVRAVADLLQPAAPLAAGWDLAEDLGGAGSRRTRLTRRPPRPGQPGAAAGGASGSGARGPDGGAATTTTTAPGGPSVVSTTPARPAAGAPPRSRPRSGPTRSTVEALAVLRVHEPPFATCRWRVACARTAARNACAASTRVTCRYQASKRRTW